jgi:hypothetical protein
VPERVAGRRPAALLHRVGKPLELRGDPPAVGWPGTRPGAALAAPHANQPDGEHPHGMAHAETFLVRERVDPHCFDPPCSAGVTMCRRMRWGRRTPPYGRPAGTSARSFPVHRSWAHRPTAYSVQRTS